MLDLHSIGVLAAMGNLAVAIYMRNGLAAAGWFVAICWGLPPVTLHLL